ncbi:MAG TPA: class I SAM-dependent methyltransferase [Candidatus Krumholzibacteria bacterium]|nr:class I SAM-dependent methyltransferase [Candidatus Krumholzibacteria bacterium]
MASATHTCRSCGSASLDSILDLGVTPLADGMRRDDQLSKPEPTFPLEVVFCHDCSLMQIDETVDPELLFAADYPYFSSFSRYLLEHSKKNVEELIEARGLGAGSFVIELASNDGYLLKNYVDHGIPVLGIDPVEGVAKAAEKIGVPTRVAFFGATVGRELAEEGKRADVVHANNVLAHVADTNGFVAGLHHILKDDGVGVIEFPYVRDLIDHVEFDTIYHEHLCYFSVTAVDKLLRRHDLYLNDVKWLPIHGGSLRLFVQRFEDVGDNVKRMLAEEKEHGVDRLEYYRDFSERVQYLRESLLGLLKALKAGGKTIAAYGAAAKGSTLINYVGIGPDLIDWVCDRNVHKQGLYMPGQDVPIVSPDAIREKKPDYLLLLPWNLETEIVAQEKEFRDAGGRFIIPVPAPRIV